MNAFLYSLIIAEKPMEWEFQRIRCGAGHVKMTLPGEAAGGRKGEAGRLTEQKRKRATQSFAGLALMVRKDCKAVHGTGETVMDRPKKISVLHKR